MKTRLVDVWYDLNGKILAVGHLPDPHPASRRAIPLVREGQAVLQVHVPEEAVAKLHETHCVDVEKCALKLLDKK